MQIRNPRWDSPDKTQILCEICPEEGPFAEQWIPFRAMKDDPMEYGKSLFDDLASGQYGAVAEQGTGQ